MDQPLYFSIVVPAHNEEDYIETTLQRLLALDYPKDSYEVIVAENGSSDRTYEKAKRFENDHVRVLTTSEAGVSRARNEGSRAVCAQADWVLFLDADTLVDPPFLRSLSLFLRSRTRRHYVAGTASLRPLPPTVPMRIVYGFSNTAFWMTRAAYGGALLVRRELLSAISFDETIQVGEDATFIAQAKSHGKFFFFHTPYVHTSTRRFQNGGWHKIPVWVGMWAFAMMVPYHAALPSTFKRRFKYKVIR